MKVLDILYVRYFKEDGSILSIGGVESYITQLGKLAVSLGIKVRVFQYGTHDFYKQADGIDVYAYFKKGKHNGDFLLKNRHKAQRKAKFYINKCRSASCMQSGWKQASA